MLHFLEISQVEEIPRQQLIDQCSEGTLTACQDY
jgi:hypothetical protein